LKGRENARKCKKMSENARKLRKKGSGIEEKNKYGAAELLKRVALIP
jgi:hypothetical protein